MTYLEESSIKRQRDNEKFRSGSNAIKAILKIKSLYAQEELIVLKEMINHLKVEKGDEIIIYGFYKKEIKISRNNNSLMLLMNKDNLSISFDDFYKNVKDNYIKDVVTYSSVKNKGDVTILKVPAYEL